MSIGGNTPGQRAFLAVLRETDIVQQQALFTALLNGGFSTEINRPIPTEGKTPLQLCACELDDNRQGFFLDVLSHSNISAGSDGESVFNCLIPIEWRKKDILYMLLDTVVEPERLALFFEALLSTAQGAVKDELMYRLPTMYPGAWVLMRQSVEQEKRLAGTRLE